MRELARLAVVAVLAASCFTAATAGVEPSPFINFQGVLRDGADNPLDGDFEMTFRFFDAAVAGSEILVDRHLIGGTGQVRVTGGTFNVVLGGGAVSDGSGAGTYANLALVFREHAAVYLEVQVGGEVLSPRTRIHSSAYALNSSHLGGKAPTEYLDTSATPQTKAGLLTLESGIESRGASAGGYFENSSGTGFAYLADDDNGISAYGDNVGGYFGAINGTGYALAGAGDYGLTAYGTVAGAYFKDNDSSSYVYAGYGNYGLVAKGNLMGASFQDLYDSGYAYCANGDYGIRAFGDGAGAYFEDTSNTGFAYVGYGDRGIWAKGTFSGGTFSHPDNLTFWADVATPTRKILGTGTVSFVQNHPYERDKVIVYAAPEGDEVAVYTRGSARLENGLARVALGPTFALVANPDLGLTAHLTPRGAIDRLWVESVETHELVVRGPLGSDVAFDYIVYGLRIGFEEVAVVQPKAREALLPDAAAIAADYGGRDELRAFGASARFQAMTGGAPVDTARADALRVAIDGDRASALAAAAAVAARDTAPRPAAPAQDVKAEPPAREPSLVAEPRAAAPAPVAAPAASQEPVLPAVLLPVSEAVEAGDVLVADPLIVGSLRRGSIGSDPRVVGVAVGAAEAGTAPVATYGVVPCKVDAGYGRIVPGDLLAASPTPAHAMHALGHEAGTLLGKALEPLDAGTGVIKVLVMPR